MKVETTQMTGGCLLETTELNTRAGTNFNRLTKKIAVAVVLQVLLDEIGKIVQPSTANFGLFPAKLQRSSKQAKFSRVSSVR
jgi:hypothetical protein